MKHPGLPFRLPAAERARQLQAFNERSEVRWFGFRGGFEGEELAVVTLLQVGAGARGGGGTGALNGGVIAAGFYAAFVLAGLGHYATDVVATLELSVQFLSLAATEPLPQFRARVLRSARHFAFAEAVLSVGPESPPLARATAMVAPMPPSGGAHP